MAKIRLIQEGHLLLIRSILATITWQSTKAYGISKWSNEDLGPMGRYMYPYGMPVMSPLDYLPF